MCYFSASLIITEQSLYSGSSPPPASFSPHKLERQALHYFLSTVPADLREKLVFIADRGFGNVEFFRFLQQLNLKFVIRVCGKVWIKVKNYQGCINQMSFSSKKVRWFAKVLYHRTQQFRLHLLLKYHRSDPWYLVSNIVYPSEVLTIYRRRMTIEEGFRDLKDGLLFKRLRLSSFKKVAKILLAGVLVYLFVLIIGSYIEQYPEIIQLISILPKRKIKLLSIFRPGLTISRKFILTEIPLQLIQAAQ